MSKLDQVTLQWLSLVYLRIRTCNLSGSVPKRCTYPVHKCIFFSTNELVFLLCRYGGSTPEKTFKVPNGLWWELMGYGTGMRLDMKTGTGTERGSGPFTLLPSLRPWQLAWITLQQHPSGRPVVPSRQAPNWRQWPWEVSNLCDPPMLLSLLVTLEP